MTVAKFTGRLSPCATGCGYLDIVHSWADNRVRYFADSDAIVWQGDDVNGGTSNNNAGQHVEPYLDCNIAVYHIDSATQVLTQYERDVATGQDLGMKWQTTLGSFWSDAMVAGIAGTISKFYAFQSANGKFVLTAHDVDKGTGFETTTLIGVLDVTDGTVLEECYALGDGTPGVRGVPTVFDDLIYQETVPGLLGLHRTTALSGREVERFEIVSSCPTLGPCLVSVENCETDRHRANTANLTPADSLARFGFARWAGLVTWGGPESLTGASNAEIQQKQKSAIHDQNPCSYTYDGDSPLDAGVENDSVWDGFFSSVHCERVYHTPSIPLGTSSQVRFVRYNSSTSETEFIPFPPKTLVDTDWNHVVEDTWPLADGTRVAESCDPETKCGDDSDGGTGEPACCKQEGGDDWLEILVTLERVDFSCDHADLNDPPDNTCQTLHDADPETNELCLLVSASASLPGGCPDDRIISLTLTGYNHSPSGLPTAMTPCLPLDYQVQDDDFWYVEGGWIFVPYTSCFYWVAEAKTLAGCEQRVVFDPGDYQESGTLCDPIINSA